jgi:hypothetical protein
MRGKDQFDTLLAQHFRDDAHRHSESDSAAAERVLAAIGHPLPRQRRAWRLWPAVLLDWNFAPAWPQLAALASCAVLGFAIGVASPALNARHWTQASQTGLGSVIAVPEPLTGALP